MSDQFQEAPKSRNKWLLPVGIGCVVILCLCGAAIGGFYLLGNQAQDYLSDVGLDDLLPTEFVEVLETPAAAEATETPEATESDMDIVAPTETTDDLGSGQFQDESLLIEDFSNNNFDWDVSSDDIASLQLENGAYSFQVLEPEYITWSYLPVYFSPSVITFDAYGLPGEQDGSFGVLCQYQDDRNFYYVEFDLQTSEYVIAKLVNDEYFVLNETLEEDYDWLTTDALNLDPTDPNTITVECSLDSITLIINEQYVNSVVVSEPFTEEGEMAFFVYAFSFAGPEGYKVFFDNVIAQ